MILPFVGVDGEGANLPDRKGFVHHQYTILRAGHQFITAEEPNNAWHRWLDFLVRLPKKQLYVAYFFDYDVTMMMRDLPDGHIHSLCRGEEIKYGPYRVRWRPRKEFRVNGYGSRTTVADVGTFFQSTFVTALERWDIGTEQERASIAEGKDDRANFGQLTQREIDYNALECRLLAALMEKFRRVCENIGYVPRTWTGPGQLAKAMLRYHGIVTSDQLPEPAFAGVWEAAQAAYYGGRFETSAVGPVKGPIEGWDINSAYPFATTNLPCLVHGQWKPSREMMPQGVYKVSFTHPPGQMWHTLPFRRPDGSIHFPRSGRGWYWSVELNAAMEAGAKITVHHGFHLTSDCSCQPFDFMYRLYSIRKAIGKTEAGIALKLAMNSVYGVLAQSIGAAPYANPVWAGLITAHTRARIMRAVMLAPEHVYMIATDGIFTSANYPLTQSEALGGWDKKTYPILHIVQPGVYFTDPNPCTHQHGDKCDCHKPKTRGVPLSAIRQHQQALMDSFTGNIEDGYRVPVRQFIGLRIATHRNSLGMAGEWVDTEKHIGYDWSTKRKHLDKWGRTWPYPGSTEEESTPYSTLIGGNLVRDMSRLEFDDAPDWASSLTELE